MKQIIINLVSNALKFTSFGSVEIYAKVDEVMEVSVKDTGVGMNAEQMSSLFYDFTKISQHRGLNKEGVGLGLTISKNLA